MKEYIINQFQTKPFGGIPGIIIVLVAAFLIAVL
jgi:hypothetical protein